MEKDVQFDDALRTARDRAARTGQSSYIWLITDGPGAEPRYIVTGPDGTVIDSEQQTATLAGIVSGTGHRSRPSCWHGACSILRDADEGIQTRR